MIKKHHQFGKAECSRCGFIYKLKALRYEWSGLKVCPDCYDPLPAQAYPRKLEAESEALWDPRPRNDRVAYTGLIQGEYTIIGRDFLGADLGLQVGEVTIG